MTMHNRSMWTELAIGALLGACILIALAMLFIGPVKAATDIPAQTIERQCLGFAEVSRIAHAVDDLSTARLYTGIPMQALLNALVVTPLVPPVSSLDLLGRTASLGVFISLDPSNEPEPVAVWFFDKDGCNFWGLGLTLPAYRALSAKLGTPA